jgi:D-ribose pyranase
MIIEGIINPHVQHLLCRVRHTNALVIADAAFPFWPDIQTVDLTLVQMNFEPHIEFKTRVPKSIGLIRTGDTTAYGNLILVSV